MNAIRRLSWRLLASLFCLSLTRPAMVSGQEAFSPEHVTRLSSVVEVKLSPDGRRAAYLAACRASLSTTPTARPGRSCTWPTRKASRFLLSRAR